MPIGSRGDISRWYMELTDAERKKIMAGFPDFPTPEEKESWALERWTETYEDYQAQRVNNLND